VATVSVTATLEPLAVPDPVTVTPSSLQLKLTAHADPCVEYVGAHVPPPPSPPLSCAAVMDGQPELEPEPSATDVAVNWAVLEAEQGLFPPAFELLLHATVAAKATRPPISHIFMKGSPACLWAPSVSDEAQRA
jgi:hypothetical protein